MAELIHIESLLGNASSKMSKERIQVIALLRVENIQATLSTTFRLRSNKNEFVLLIFEWK